MDNLNIHYRKSLADVFGGEMAAEVWDRFTLHYTPTHGSWRNQAEIEIGIFSRQCLGHRRIPDLEILRQEAKAWNRRMNRDHVKIAWKFDRKIARRKFGYKKKAVRDLGAYLDRWLATYAKPNVAGKTYERYEQIIEKDIKPARLNPAFQAHSRPHCRIL